MRSISEILLGVIQLIHFLYKDKNVEEFYLKYYLE